MNKPKRHHWWPVVQSKHWTDENGWVYVTRRDGTYFQTSPLNIGLESELYTRFDEDDVKDTGIEEWFAETIDGPVAATISHLLDPSNIKRVLFRGDPVKAKTVKELGFRVNPYVDSIVLPQEVRRSIACYIAALLVRHPNYLRRLQQFHMASEGTGGDARNRSLDSMLHLHRVYSDVIAKADILVTRRTGTTEYLYADGGLSVKEPWAVESLIPFDIHAPLTPDIASQVFPVPNPIDLSTAKIAEVTNQGVSRQNRIILERAGRFVFSRQMPPVSFIREHFGIPAPNNIRTQVINGRVHVMYDPSRS